MDLLRSAPVLPSNAPAFTDSQAAERSTSHRVLQEHSGNRQSDTLTDSFNGFKLGLSSPTENSYADRSTNYSQSRSYRDRKRKAREEAQNDRIARRLYQQFWSSEGYRKYRNRQPQQKDQKPVQQKWPDDIEEVFFRALVRHPPMGRKKLTNKGFLRGRNELIADFIYECTGHKRTRKQISSHIQFLKPLVVDNAEIMRYLAKEEPRHHYRYAQSRSGLGRQLSTHVSQGPYDHATTRNVPSALMTEAPTLHSIPSMPCLRNLEPIDFSMFVQDPHASKEPKILYTYTQFADQPRLPDLRLDDPASLERAYPQLAMMHSNGSLDCPVIVAEASIEILSASLPQGLEMGISFELSSARAHSPPSLKWCLGFFENGKHIDESAMENVTNAFPMNDSNVYSIPFGSHFWAVKFHTLGNRLQEAQRILMADPETLDHTSYEQRMVKAVQIREHVAASLSNLTAVQEIIDESNGTRMLVIYWTFRQAPSGTKGQTTWRELFLPPSIPDSQLEPKLMEFGATKFEDFSQTSFDFQVPPVDTPQSYNQPTLQSPIELNALPHLSVNLPPAEWPVASASSQDVITTPDYAQDNAMDFTGGHININMQSMPPMEPFDLPGSMDFAAPLTGQDDLPQQQQYPRAWDAYGDVFAAECYQLAPQGDGFARLPAADEYRMPQPDGFFAASSLYPPPGYAAGGAEVGEEEVVMQAASFLVDPGTGRFPE
ncbi:hypothetical protein LTR50_003104 [Elasticomyces elasticus]|nr:hypothetical protein LTR50_003104 [Elasticomyces elasticus]